MLQLDQPEKTKKEKPAIEVEDVRVRVFRICFPDAGETEMLLNPADEIEQSGTEIVITRRREDGTEVVKFQRGPCLWWSIGDATIKGEDQAEG